MTTDADAQMQEPPGDELFAAEYALGVLDGRQRGEAQARIAIDPAFAELVHDWEQRFGSFLAQVPPEAVRALVWLRVRTRLGWLPAAAEPSGLWHDLRFWRGATAGGLALAAVLAMVAVLRPVAPLAPGPVPTPPPVVSVPPAEAPEPVVVLSRDDGAAGWLAAVDAANAEVTMTPVPAPADPQGRVGELWLIPAGGAPQSLGFVSGERAHTVSVPDALRGALVAGSLLAITLEPEAGIPHAAPTGPIVAKGQIETI